MAPSTPDPGDVSLDQLVELERRAAEAAAQADGDADDAGDADEVVLPWWQHPVNIVTMVVTAAVLAGLIGWMAAGARATPGHNEVDVGFLQDMRVHHEQAVLMSEIYRSRDDIDAGLDTVARSIIRGQNIEIGRMIQMLRDVGELEANESDTSMAWMGHATDSHEMPGMASEADLDRLANSDGREADELFVRLMTVHHLGGIEMAEYEVEHGEYDEAVDMAASMAAAQASEIAEMLGLLES